MRHSLAWSGTLAAQVQPVFVSIDPQRDTPQALGRVCADLRRAHSAAELEYRGSWRWLQVPFGVVFYKVPGPTPDEYGPRWRRPISRVSQRVREEHIH